MAAGSIARGRLGGLLLEHIERIAGRCIGDGRSLASIPRFIAGNSMAQRGAAILGGCGFGLAAHSTHEKGGHWMPIWAMFGYATTSPAACKPHLLPGIPIPLREVLDDRDPNDRSPLESSVNADEDCEEGVAGGPLSDSILMIKDISEGDKHTRFLQRTYQPNKRKRKRTHGFLSRMSTRGGRRVLRKRTQKGRWRVSC